jgi:CubicO group peptidase (beta-lactamase class C family)
LEHNASRKVIQVALVIKHIYSVKSTTRSSMLDMRASNLIFLSSASTAAATLCPFLGPVFPPPKTLTSDALFLTGLRQSIESALLTGTTLHGPVSSNDTYSIQIFSTSDNGVPLLDFHHRGTSLVGNDTLNGDSIYRIASVTKVLTVYLLLLAEAGDGILSDLVVKYLPELKGKGVWDEITVGDLAGYMSGIVGDGEFSLS